MAVMGAVLKLEDFVSAPSKREKKLEARVEALKAEVARLKRNNKELVKALRDPFVEQQKLLNRQTRLLHDQMAYTCTCTPSRADWLRR
jgi:cell division protein FtsB